MTKTATLKKSVLEEAREEFIAQWGALGTAWGINRTMAQIHAFLLISAESSSTDEVMEHLEISRGNANSNLREMVGWGLARSVVKRGDRKEYFEAEKEVWKIFCIISRERKKREIEPAISVLKNCLENTRGLNSPEAKAFHRQMAELSEFVGLASSILEKIATSEQNKIMPKVIKLFS